MKVLFTMENLRKVMFIFLLTFPIFDLNIFYNSITTLVRVCILLFCYCWLFSLSKQVRKWSKWLLGYLVVLGLYFLCHHYHAMSFTSLVPGNFDYSIMKEFLYFVKLSMPVFMIPLLWEIQLTKQDYRRVIGGWVLLISGSIIVTNLFTFSYGSYSDELIKGNIFSWFFTTKNGYTYYELASKGFFMYANQISTILLLLVPCLFLWYQQDTNKWILGLLGILLLSMMIIGTRVASIGGIIILFLCIIAYLFFTILKRKQIHKKLLTTTGALVGILLLLLPFSPSVNRANVLGNITDSSVATAKSPLTVLAMNDMVGKIDKITYIQNHYQEKRIAEQFILKAYPYQYDPDFWYAVMMEPVQKRIDYRYLEISMIKRVCEINNSPWDKWLGITNTRVQNIFNIERDFILQYYSFGILGLLLFLLPYFAAGYLLIKNWIQNFSLRSSFGLVLMILYVGCSYVAGNNMNHLSTIIPFFFLISFFVKPEEKIEK